jgi:hypothetical protein
MRLDPAGYLQTHRDCARRGVPVRRGSLLLTWSCPDHDRSRIPSFPRQPHLLRRRSRQAIHQFARRRPSDPVPGDVAASSSLAHVSPTSRSSLPRQRTRPHILNTTHDHFHRLASRPFPRHVSTARQARPARGNGRPYRRRAGEGRFRLIPAGAPRAGDQSKWAGSQTVQIADGTLAGPRSGAQRPWRDERSGTQFSAPVSTTVDTSVQS